MYTRKPWSSMEHSIQHFRNEIESMITKVFNDTSRTFTPKCNVIEEEDYYLLEVEVPGIDPKDIEIKIEGEVLTIKGERKQKSEVKDKTNKIHVVEQSHGSFYRPFTLPYHVDTDHIKAENKAGILSIYLPKSKKRKSRQIDIE